MTYRCIPDVKELQYFELSDLCYVFLLPQVAFLVSDLLGFCLGILP